MSLVSEISDLATRIGTEIKAVWLAINTRQDPLQFYQTFTLHASGSGQQDMPIWIPWNCYIKKFRYRIATAGSGGSITAELRVNGVAGGNTLSGSSATPSTSPSWTTPTAPGLSLSADDLVYAWFTAVNSTPGAQMKVEMLLERRT